ncbi:MAG TPA: anti-sigma factor [Candidatus Limnocylindrales bacterium]|jgi:hypothetical protein
MTTPRTLTCDEMRDLAPLFVLDALEPAEMTAVREHLAGCADAHLELLELGETGTALLDTIEPAEPPARLRSSLLAAAADDLAAGRHPSAATTARPTPVREGSPAVAAVPPAVAAVPPAVAAATAAAASPSNVIDLAARTRRGSRLGWLVAVAAAVAVLLIGGSNLALRHDLDAAEAYRDGVTRALDLAAKPGSVTALLTSGDGTVSGFAVVGADGTVRITMKGLAPTTGSQVYTAWAIEGDAAPVAMNDFTVGADGVVSVTGTSPTSAPGATLALTLEPGPGAATPTLPVVAAGVTRDPAG